MVGLWQWDALGQARKLRRREGLRNLTWMTVIELASRLASGVLTPLEFEYFAVHLGKKWVQHSVNLLLCHMCHVLSVESGQLGFL